MKKCTFIKNLWVLSPICLLLLGNTVYAILPKSGPSEVEIYVERLIRLGCLAVGLIVLLVIISILIRSIRKNRTH